MSNIVRNVLAAIAAVVLTAWQGAAVGTSSLARSWIARR